jgi:hypothetical protein
MSFTVLNSDFFLYWLFSRFSHLAAPEVAHLELSGQASMFHLKLLINFLSLSIVGQIDWHAFGNS